MIRETLPDDLANFPITVRQEWFDHLRGGDTRTIEIDGDIVALFGVFITSPGVGHVWVNLSPEAGEAHALRLVRAARKLVFMAMEIHGLRRLQTMTDADDYQLGRWLGLCGFTAEAVLLMAGPNGEDKVIYRKLKEH